MVTNLYRILLSNWKRVVLALLGVAAALVLLVRGCAKEAPPSPLGKDELARVEVDGRKLRITTPKGTTEQFIPDTAKVTVRTDGVIDVKVKKLGIKAELGGGVAITASRMKLELDTRIAYAWKLSLHGGITFDPAAQAATEWVRPLLFGAYPLPFRWTPNTSVWVGAELPIWVGQTTAPCGGLRVRF